jgi:purine-nucleoside phosphorylase
MSKKQHSQPGLSWPDRRKEAAAYVRSQCPVKPQIGLILGSGLGPLADEITGATVIPYRDIPHFPVSTVQGHAGELVIGVLEGKRVVAMKGRIHYYEGYSMQEVVFPVWVMRTLGATHLIATCAAGGANRSFTPGDLMIIVDHINWMFDNPLIGPNDDELGPRFPGMGLAYPWELVEVAQRAADAVGIKVQRGVYIGTSGPCYSSMAESQIYRLLRADAVGMSTVPEIMAAVHAGMKTMGIAAITDVGKDPKAGQRTVTTHEEVLRVANELSPRFIKLMKAIIHRLEV